MYLVANGSGNKRNPSRSYLFLILRHPLVIFPNPLPHLVSSVRGGVLAAPPEPQLAVGTEHSLLSVALAATGGGRRVVVPRAPPVPAAAEDPRELNSDESDVGTMEIC